MTNSCYSYRVYNMYRVGTDPVKLNLYCRKRIRNRLFYRLFRGRMYWVSLDILHKIHEIYRTMDDTAQYRIHRIMHRIAHFERIVCRIARLEASLIAILN